MNKRNKTILMIDMPKEKAIEVRNSPKCLCESIGVTHTLLRDMCVSLTCLYAELVEEEMSYGSWMGF